MLHIFVPVEPAGQPSFMPYVHCCEHTGWPIMSKLLVHTPLAHSVDVLLAVVQAAPNAAPSLVELESVQAQNTSEHARRRRCIAPTLHAKRAPLRRRGSPSGVTFSGARSHGGGRRVRRGQLVISAIWRASRFCGSLGSTVCIATSF